MHCKTYLGAGWILEQKQAHEYYQQTRMMMNVEHYMRPEIRRDGDKCTVFLTFLDLLNDAWLVAVATQWLLPNNNNRMSIYKTRHSNRKTTTTHSVMIEFTSFILKFAEAMDNHISTCAFR